MYRVRTSLSGWLGGPGLSTMYFDSSGGLTATNAALAVQAFWNAIKGNMHTDFRVDVDAAVETLELDGEVTAVTNAAGLSQLSGTASGEILPYATQGVLQWRTGTYLGGREIRGRTFLPMATEGLSSAAPTSGYRSVADAAAAALIADANSALWVWSKTKAAAAPVVSGLTWSKWGVLRSRRD